LESGIAAKLLGLSPMKNLRFERFTIPRRKFGRQKISHRPPNTGAAVTGAAWTNWPTRRSSRTGCTANFRRARATDGGRPSRRHFLKIMSASFALAGVATLGAGCRRPEEHLEPFGKQPENYTFGEPQYFATAMPTRTGAIPLVVKSYEGRPVKIEGNALYPGSNGGTDRYAQASILDLYDPDRARHFKHDGKVVSRDEALKFLDDLSQNFPRIKAKVWRFSRKAARRRRARGCKKSSRRNFRNRNGSLTTRLIPASINARPRRRSASR
jgi:hypothetical protein